MRVARQAIENGHPDTAVEFAQKAAEAAPDNPEPMWLLAQAYGLQDGESNAKMIAQNTVNTDAEAPKNASPKQVGPKIATIAEKLNKIAPASGKADPAATKPMPGSRPKP